MTSELDTQHIILGNMNKENLTKLAIIGAGPAGLVATKRATESGSSFKCCTFELCDNVGGTWIYTDEIGKDEHGIPIHSSMYQNLKTNLPKEIMILPEYQYEREKNRSFIDASEVLQYFEDYADHYGLRKYIKFRHYVKNISPQPGGKWKITVIDLENQKENNYHNFDAVIICVGKLSSPLIPRITNIENFSGFQMHSHDYKEPSKFKNQIVLIIGGKSSATDISIQICATAQKVYLSHHNEKIRNIPFPNNLQQKPDVREIQDGNIVFVDGSKIFVDTILYCTGYTCEYPFLDPMCKVTTENGTVKPLYKHFINIEHPTMCIVGIPRTPAGIALFDLQISSFLNILKKEVSLPNKAEMYAELEREITNHREITGKLCYHNMTDKEAKEYCSSLAEFGKTVPVKPVIFDIHSDCVQKAQTNLMNYRNTVYEIINDHKYISKKLNALCS